MKRRIFLKAALVAAMVYLFAPTAAAATDKPTGYPQPDAKVSAVTTSKPLDAYATMTRSQKRELDKLWKTYEKADRYADREAVLQEIKTKAAAGQFSVDYLSAGVQLLELRCNRNWKVREAETQTLQREVDSLDYLLERSWIQSFSNLKELVETRADDLRSRRTSVLYDLSYGSDEQYQYLINWGWWPLLNQNRTLPPVETIANDYELAVWLLLFDSYKDSDRQHWADVLKKEAAGRYPVPEIAEYYTVQDSTGYVAFRDKFSGQGVSLLAEAWLIEHEKQLADNRNETEVNVYKRLRERCETFRLTQKNYRKDQTAKKIQTVERIIQDLDQKRISFACTDSSALILFKNLTKGTFRITHNTKNTDGEKFSLSQTVVNPAGRYYLTDTVVVPLTQLPDGSYLFRVKSQGIAWSNYVDYQSLAIVWRNTAGFREAYFTDSRSGRPVDSLSVWITRNDTIDTDHLLVRDFRPDGFTKLPEELERLVADSVHTYSWRVTTRDADGLWRTSERMNLNRLPIKNTPLDSWQGAIYLDRSVVNPGEMVRFKGIGWIRHADGSRQVLAENSPIRALLSGPGKSDYASLSLTTNAFGSVSGSFQIDKDAKGGNWTIYLLDGNQRLGSTSFIVGEVVLPTFEVAMDPMTDISLPGEPMTLTGSVTYLSGHKASGTQIKWRWNGYEQETACDDNGRFILTVTDTVSNISWGSLHLEATSPEGETQTLNKSYSRIPGLTISHDNPGSGKTSAGYSVLDQRLLKVHFTVSAPDGSPTTYPVDWTLKARHGGTWQEVLSGTIAAGKLLEIDLKEQDAVFQLEASTSATNVHNKVFNTSVTRNYLVVSSADSTLQAPVPWFLEKVESEGVEARFGGAAGDLWAIAELWGRDPAGNTVRLGTRRLHIDGTPGAAGSLQRIRFDRKPDWSEDLRLTVLWVKNRTCHREQLDYRIPRQELPLAVTRFTDAVNPGSESIIKLHTTPGVEGVAVVYDKAMEAIRSNVWRIFGSDGSSIRIPGQQLYRGAALSDQGRSIRAYGIALDVLDMAGGVKTRAAGGRKSSVMLSANASMVEEAAPLLFAKELSVEDRVSAGVAEPKPESLRSDLAPVLAFEPFLYPDADGNISFTVKASDRLSQFVVRTLVHDKSARSAVVERLMTVTLPVKVGFLPPSVLHVGDRIAFAATAANSSEVPVSGQLSLRLYEGRYTPGAAPLKTLTEELTVAAGNTLGFDFQEVTVPSGISDTLGVLVAFTSDGATDALSLAVPVQARSKQITETHSMLLRDGEDLAAAKAALEARFQNAAPGSIVFEERTIAEMLDRLEKQLCRYEREDAISLANALLVKTLLGQPTDSLAQKLALCRNADGGYGWMKGMNSSPYVTAMLLDRFARMGKRDADTRQALQYLDATCLGTKTTPFWRGGISMPIYLYIRSLFPELPIVGKTSYARDEEARRWLDPRREDRNYSSLFDRALRARTLLNMTASDQGVDLAKHFGLTFFAEKKLRRSLETEAANLLDYAVEHPSGGWYYPNLVMPWRGLMECEAYAHTFMCDIMRDIARRDGESRSGEPGLSRRALFVPESGTAETAAALSAEPVTAAQIADGIRLWLLVQRETQAWTEEPAYALAVAAIREGSPELLQTRVLIARSTAELPFEQIKASGNGMKIERQWQVKLSGKWTVVTNGTRLCVGDCVRSVLNLHSDENRSFVVVTAPRPGNLQPVNQISGYAGARGGYRDVRSNRTEYLFDAYPEEKLTLTEEYRVTHSGSFTYAPAEIVCTYADHYRATDRYRPALISTQPQK